MDQMNDRASRPPADPETTDIARTLNGARAYIQSLPPFEQRVANLAADGSPIWEIAQLTETSEEAIARILHSTVAVLTGRPIEPVETGGLGSDTDPGVTGGYGDTGFGAIDTEPPADSTEPEEPK